MKNSKLLVAALVAVLSAGVGCAFAQAPTPEQAPGQGAGGGQGRFDPARRAEFLEKRFKEANKAGDGKLTKAEAEAGFPRVAKHFDEIDKDHKGYVTLDQIKAAGDALRGN